MEAVQWVLEQYRKHSSFANFSKCWFYQNKIRFLGFVVLAEEIRIEEKRIKTVITWSEFQSVRNIQVFLSFDNFYQTFIQNFSRIVALLIWILRIFSPDNSDPTDKEAGNIEIRKENVGDIDSNEIVDGSIENLSNLVKSKKINLVMTNLFRADFLTPKARKTFIQVWKAFTEVTILCFFDPECYIRNKTDASRYAIS